MQKPNRFLCSAAAALLLLSAWPVLAATAEVRVIAFPTDVQLTSFGDDFGDVRAGHSHEGVDILGKKMLPLYSAIDGWVRYVVIPEANYGYAIVLEDNDGYTYHYLHVNNDTPGTDDGNGGVEHAYAPGIERGVHVTKGQLVGWMGDSGNAELVGAHLHFEIRLPGGTAINPYPSLLAAKNFGSYSVSEAKAASPDINTDKGLVAGTVPVPCVSGRRIKLATSSTVYYCGADGRRYVFPNNGTYFTWYTSFSGVTTLTSAQMAAVPLGGNVTYRPGVKLVKIQTDPKVYAVEHGGILRWVQSPGVAEALYGATWATKVDDVPDAFFFNYRISDPVLSAR